MSTPITHNNLIDLGFKHKASNIYHMYLHKNGSFIYPHQVILFPNGVCLTLFDIEGNSSGTFIVDTIEKLTIIVDAFRA